MYNIHTVCMNFYYSYTYTLIAYSLFVCFCNTTSRKGGGEALMQGDAPNTDADDDDDDDHYLIDDGDDG